MSLIEDLQWRYATKKFDSTKKVSQSDIDKLVEAARLAPTSSGLQPFRVLVVSNPELKDKMVPIAMNQQQVADCSHVLVFAAWNRYSAERIDSIYDFTTEERGLAKGFFGAYTDKLKSIYLPQDEKENFEHIARQTYIALALVMAQAAELKIDSTPMEGFYNDQLDELLNLSSLGLKSVSILPVGYRDASADWLVNMKKVRLPKEEFVIEMK